MSLSDPQTITIDGVANSLARVETQATKSIYRTADTTVKLTISHQESKGRTRRMMRIDSTVVAADPLTAVNQYKTGAVYLVTDFPLLGFSIDDIDDIVQGFKAWLVTATVSKILGGEH